MSDYEVLVAEAEHLRIYKNKPAKAIEKYKQALAIGGPQDRHIKHMIGVCYRQLGHQDDALEWCRQARLGATSYQDGNILRDMAESYSVSGQFIQAMSCLHQSLDKLSYVRHPAKHGATLGFLARTELRMDKTAEAVKHFAVADVILHQEENRHFELYNKLPYAAALSLNGQWIKARLVVLSALRLAFSYGAGKHRLHAIILLLGGYRLEDFLERRRRH